MATAESVKSKIQGLIDTANETTGGSDADLTTAIATLVAGFGKGDVVMASGTFVGATTVTHGLGVVPDIISIGSVKTINISSGTPLQRIVVISSALKEKMGIINSTFYTYSAGTNSRLMQNGATYGTVASIDANENTFKVSPGLPYQPRSGESYEWFAIGGLA